MITLDDLNDLFRLKGLPTDRPIRFITSAIATARRLDGVRTDDEDFDLDVSLKPTVMKRAAIASKSGSLNYVHIQMEIDEVS